MFAKKKKNSPYLKNFSSDSNENKEVKPKKVLVSAENIDKGTLVKRKIEPKDIEDVELGDFETNPLLTSTNNINFLKKIINITTEPLKLDKHLSDETKQVIYILAQLQDYLPYEMEADSLNSNIFITLTYAQSLDSKIGYRYKKTAISHLETKQMTHFLRYYHDCIVVGFNTFKEDNPNLNFKYFQDTMKFFFSEKEKYLVPLILDPKLRIIDYIKENGEENINLKKNYELKTGAKPVFVCLNSNHRKLEECSSDWFDVMPVPDDLFYNFENLFSYIHSQNRAYRSFMIEGGATIINEILKEDIAKPFIDSKIITIAPIFLGDNAVSVTPKLDTKMELTSTTWVKGTKDVVLLSKK